MISEYALDLLVTIASTVVLALGAAFWRWTRQARARERRRDDNIDRIISVFEGTTADPIRNLPPSAGLLAQLDGIREQLHRNGGTTLRDAVSRVELQVDEIRVAQLKETRQAALDRHRARTIEALLRQHMRDGQELLEVGQRNDDRLWAALRGHGIDIDDPEPLPPVILTMPDDEKSQED